MKYVSPATEKRMKTQKKRRRQILIIVCGACLALGIIGVLFFVFKGINGNRQNITPEQESQSVQQEVISQETEPSAEKVQQEENLPNTAAEETSSQTEVKPVKDKKEKVSVFSKIKNFFSKNKYNTGGGDFPVNAFGKTVEAPAKTVVSLSPTATEIMLSLPVQKTLVAVSEYCNNRGQDIMTVGTPLIPKIDKIIQIAPEYLIVQTPLKEEDKIKIEQSGIKILQFESPKTMDNLKEIYRSTASLVWGKKTGQTIAENIIHDIETKLKMYNFSLESTDKKAALLLFNSYGIAATKDTLEGEILTNFFNISNGGTNYYAGSLQELAQSNPQVIIAPDTFTVETIAALGFDQTPAYTSGQIYFVPISDFENTSPKIIMHLSGIANKVYGENIKIVTTEDIYPQEKKKG